MKKFFEKLISLYDIPKDYYKEIRQWFYCNWNIEHWRLIKQAFFSYGWDHWFLTKLEERQIDKALRWFKYHQHMIDEQYEEIVRYLHLAKHLIHIINNAGEGLYDYEGDLEFIPVIKDVKGNLVDSPNNTKAELFKLDDSNLKYIYNGHYVNYRNINRFVGDKLIKYYTKNTHEYYLIKCKHLYYKIRERYTDYWWD